MAIKDYRTELAPCIPAGVSAFGGVPIEPVQQEVEVPVETRFDGANGKGKLAICSVCGYAYPIAKMVKKSGKYYCLPMRCSMELEGLK